MKSKQIINKPIYKNKTNHKDKLAQLKHSKILQKKNRVEHSEIISPNNEPNYDNLYFFYKKHKVLFIFVFSIYLMSLAARVNGKVTKESIEHQSRNFTKNPFLNEENSYAKNQTLFNQSSIVDELPRVPHTPNQEYLPTNWASSNKMLDNFSLFNSTKKLAVPLKNKKVSKIEDITHKIEECYPKQTGVSAGKVCIIDGEKYLLKVTNIKEEITDRISDSELGMYNLHFARQNIGLLVPQVNFMYEKNGSFRTTGGELVYSEHYLGSKYIENFETFRIFYENTKKKIIKNTFRLNKSRLSEDEVKQMIFDKFVNKVGEHEFAKLAVSGTFIQDLVMNFGNWGIVNNQIAVIDADHSPKSIEEYLIEATKMPGNVEIPFCLNTVLQMKSIYESMLKLPPVKLGLSIDMPDKQYSILVEYYHNACELAIKNIQENFPKRNPNQRSKEITEMVSEAFLMQYKDFAETKSNVHNTI